ncbi:hypothetical protein GCM10011371_04690 [Novosphingobium marinum]|nr:hypothetical protein GCM10011371_04690 [Novosphingobium marinum]
MGQLARQLEHDKAVRDSARSQFDTRLAQVKTDLEARGIGGRIADKVANDAMAIADEASDVASEHRGVIAGTIVALALWFLRHPIIAWIDTLLGDEDD